MLVNVYFASLLAASVTLAASSEAERRGNSGISINGGGLSGRGPIVQVGGGGSLDKRLVHARGQIRGGVAEGAGSKACNPGLVVSPLLLSSLTILLGLFA
ncbi:hypothetical protein Pst134EA_000427 [Puccinia striiformis f. sp. tritici]|uniref:Secreted protein n=2 Tax=Puccinia striiformis TaxID=27350 RepID=A0A0L0VP38_9BASI|nr:hypothetical protein Pst134EA_000427 [Puccinia striiformis f. sp. tritici]KAH9473355.1 hypothetical protein Pst134EA_000427 [Puccinia striiformis f. sp. tritici]KAI9600086.1 hypothetical protein KEM48_000302 [Puccinia striiformis f. sp. tritici PST-130]KNF01021.1 hypothetical protein PSTG_05654 [Puccinia striiformis f. sp. tritici PST-78]POW09340.1 hypothetical protein PSTT_06876 [Puccinia striiformis]